MMQRLRGSPLRCGAGDAVGGIERGAGARAGGGRRLGLAGQAGASTTARKALDSDDFATAEQKFREAIALDPKLNDAYWRLAAILYGKKKYSEAVELLRRAPDQTDIDVREQLGLTLYKTANPPPAESVRLLEDVVSKRPDSYAAQLQLGQHSSRREPQARGRGLRGLPQVSSGRRRPSLDPQVHMLLGTALLLAKDWDAAQREFEGLLKTKPNDMTAKLMLGAVFVGKGRLQPGHLALRAHPRRGAASSRASTTTSAPAICANARRRRVARGRALRQGQAAATPRATCSSCDALLRAEELSARARRVPGGGAARSGQRRRSRARSAASTWRRRTTRRRVTYLEQAVAGEGAGPGKDPEMLGALAEAYAAMQRAQGQAATRSADELASPTKDREGAGDGGPGLLPRRQRRARDGRAQDVARASSPTTAAPARRLVKVLNRRAGSAVEKNEIGARLAACSSEAAEADARRSDDQPQPRAGAAPAQELLRGGAGAAARRSRRCPTTWCVNRMLGRAQLGQHKNDGGAWRPTRRRRRWRCACAGRSWPASTPSSGRSTSTTTSSIRRSACSSTAVQGRRARRRWCTRRSATWRSPTSSAGWSGCAIPSRPRARSTTSSTAAKAPKGVAHRQGDGGGVAAARRFAALKANKISQARGRVGRGGQAGGDSACSFQAALRQAGRAVLRRLRAVSRLGSPQQARGRGQAVHAARRPSAPAPDGRLAARAVALGATSSWPTTSISAATRSAPSSTLSRRTKVPAKGDRRELEHNLAVIDLFAGQARRRRSGCSTRSATRPCEALVNLGIVRDRQGESKKALELYKRAMARGRARAQAAEWIDVKERLFGGGRRSRDGAALLPALLARRWRRDARAADKPITIAIYAPNAPFESGADRFAFVNRLAQQITSVAGRTGAGQGVRARRPISRPPSRPSRSTSPSSTASTSPSAACPSPCWRRRPRAAIPSRAGRCSASTAASVQDLQGKKLSHGGDRRRATPPS